MEDFSSCTTNSGSYVQAMTAKFTSCILWDWRFVHHVYKACEHIRHRRFPSRLEEPVVREVIRKAIKIAENIYKSPLPTAEFKDLQVSHTSMLNSTYYEGTRLLTPCESMRVGAVIGRRVCSIHDGNRVVGVISPGWMFLFLFQFLSRHGRCFAKHILAHKVYISLDD